MLEGCYPSSLLAVWIPRLPLHHLKLRADVPRSYRSAFVKETPSRARMMYGITRYLVAGGWNITGMLGHKTRQSELHCRRNKAQNRSQLCLTICLHAEEKSEIAIVDRVILRWNSSVASSNEESLAKITDQESLEPTKESSFSYDTISNNFSDERSLRDLALGY